MNTVHEDNSNKIIQQIKIKKSLIVLQGSVWLHMKADIDMM